MINIYIYISHCLVSTTPSSQPPGGPGLARGLGSAGGPSGAPAAAVRADRPAAQRWGVRRCQAGEDDDFMGISWDFMVI